MFMKPDVLWVYLPDNQDRSSSIDEDLPEDAGHGADEGVDEDKEEEDDRLVMNSSEQLDSISFEEGQLVDEYNYRYFKKIYTIMFISPMIE
jgi:hypothetical protein